MTGQGGWPMTCVLDHDGSPFFAGTYFPDQPRHGQPSFRQVLTALTDAWRDRGDDVRRVAGRPCASTSPSRSAACRRAPLDAERAGRRGRDAGQRVRRGATAASAAPRSSRRRWCWSSCCGTPRARVTSGRWRCSTRPARRWRAAGSTTSSAAASRATASTARWVVPHFEKMLYDNAQLLGLYARWGGAAGGAGRRVRPPTSCCASCAPPRAASPRRSTPTARARRAGSTSGRPTQLVDVLGADDGAWAAQAVRGAPAGTFEHGTSTLQLLHDPDDPGAQRLVDVRTSLLAARETRVRPARDDKVVAAWNGLAIAGLVRRRRAARTRRSTSTPRSTAGELLVDRAPRRRPAAAGLARRRGRPARRRARGLRLRGGGLPRPVRATGDERWLERAPACCSTPRWRCSAPTTAASTTPPPTREALVARPARPVRQRQPVGARRRPCTPCSAYAALTGSRPPPRRGRGGARDGGRARRAGAAVRRLVARRGRGDARRTRSRSRWSGRPVPSATRSSDAARRRARGRWWSSPTGRAEDVPLLAGRDRGRRPPRGVRLPQPGLRAPRDRPRRPALTDSGHFVPGYRTVRSGVSPE